jgi:hypothetical protein
VLNKAKPVADVFGKHKIVHLELKNESYKISWKSAKLLPVESPQCKSGKGNLEEVEHFSKKKV